MAAGKAVEPTRFLALYDIHIGREYKRSANAWPRSQELRNTHDLKALKIVRDFTADFQPHVVLLGGDQLNCGPISHWNKQYPRLTEKFRLREEMDILNREVLRPMEEVVRKTTKNKQRLIWLTGNHEAWIDRYLDENPGLEGLIEPRVYLDLDKRGWEFYEQGKIAKIGKLHWIHGDNVPGGINACRRLAYNYRRNIRAGHRHTYEVATDVTPVDRRDYHTAVYLPALCNTSPAYEKNSSTNHQKGFDYGYTMDDGSFNDYVVIINNNSCIVNGRRYAA